MSAISRISPAIPLSPPSPPDFGVKERSKILLPANAPQSPASPPLMSVATKSYASFANTQSSSDAPTSNQTFSAPPSASNSTQEQRQSTTANSASLPSPTSSINAVNRISEAEDQDRHRNKRQKIDSAEMYLEDEMDTDQSPALSSSGPQHLNPPSQQLQDTKHSGSSGVVPATSPELQGSDLASDYMSLEQLQKDTGDAFLLCKSTFQRSRPNPSQNLLALYGLSPLHATVARTDPMTGEKINKLRKSYEGKIKDFALAGRNKPYRVDIPEGGKGKLRSMMEDILEEQWQTENASKKIEITEDFKSVLRKATLMRPGTTRDNEFWEEALGHEKARLPAVPEAPLRKNMQTAGPPRLSNGVVRAPVSAEGDVARPRRANKKRSYVDDSFEGYGDGFVDDEADADAASYSNSEDGGGGPGRKKRKKVEMESATNRFDHY